MMAKVRRRAISRAAAKGTVGVEVGAVKSLGAGQYDQIVCKANRTCLKRLMIGKPSIDLC